MIDWQPIATAPREGTPVLIWMSDADRGLPGAEVAQWHGDCWWTNGGPNAGSDMPEWLSATHWASITGPA